MSQTPADTATEELRRLIEQNRRMEQKLRDLQLAIAGIRADFETAVSGRVPGHAPHIAPRRPRVEAAAR